MLQEQNALPGLTNRLLARVARKVATAFRECEAYFGSKAVLTGNPVRADFSQVPGRSGTDPFTLLVFGGSQGAQPINQSVIEALAILKPQIQDLKVIHQTGEREYPRIKQAYEAMKMDADVRPFFGDIPKQFAAADLLVCRAGATTLAELTVSGKPAILVPFPQAADDHQRKNAEALAQAGAAEMILQKDLNGPVLAARIRYYFEHRDELRRMEQNSRAFGRPDATERIVDLVEELSGLRQPVSQARVRICCTSFPRMWECRSVDQTSCVDQSGSGFQPQVLQRQDAAATLLKRKTPCSRRFRTFISSASAALV